jgi:hypothetical protein
MGTAARFACVVFVTLAIAAGAVAPAHAGSRGDVPPPDVQRVFDEEAIPLILATASGEGGSPSVFEDITGIANITEVHMFSADYVNGRPTDTPYLPSGEWVATIMADFVAVGTVRVWTPTGGDPQIAGFDGDVEIGGKLAEAVGIDYIEDPRISASYAASGDTIGPFDEQAAAELPEPMSFEEFQPILFARVSQGGAIADPGPGIGLVFGALALALAAGIAVVVSARVRARRAATGSSPGHSGTGPPVSR